MQYSTPPGKSNVKLTIACVAIDSIENDSSRKWSHHSRRVSVLTGNVGKYARYYGKTLCGIFNLQNYNKSFSPLYMYDLNTKKMINS